MLLTFREENPVKHNWTCATELLTELLEERREISGTKPSFFSHAEQWRDAEPWVKQCTMGNHPMEIKSDAEPSDCKTALFAVKLQ